MDKPNVRLIIRALRKKTNAKLAIQQNKHLLGEGTEGVQSDVPPKEDPLPGRELNREINDRQIPLPGF
jgi:hypothetical protein